MRHYHKTTNKYHCPIINLDKIWSLVGEEVRLNPPLLDLSSPQDPFHLASIFMVALNRLLPCERSYSGITTKDFGGESFLSPVSHQHSIPI